MKVERRKQKCQWRDKVENPCWEACHDKQREADSGKKKSNRKAYSLHCLWNRILESPKDITAFSPNKSYFWKANLFSLASLLCPKAYRKAIAI